MLKKLLLGVLLFQCAFSYAQGINGRVTDGQKKPLAYATVSLLSRVDSAVLATRFTDKEGMYSLQPHSSAAFVRVSYIGFKTLTVPLAGGSYKEISLAADASLMKEINITARPPALSLKDGSLVVHVKNSMMSNIGTANRLLGKIPGIKSGMDGIEVHGKGKPLVYLNNRLVRNSSELEQLPSAEVESVEVNMNPGAEYDASVAAVIRIKTIRKQGDGLSGNVLLGGVYAEDWQHRQTLNLNYRKKEVDVFGSVDNLKASFIGYNRERISLRTDSLRVLGQNTDAEQQAATMDAKLGVSYNHKASSMGVLYNTAFSPYKWNKGQGATHQDFSVNEALGSKSLIDYSLNLSNQTHRVNAYYTTRFKSKLGLDFNYDYFGGNDKNDRQLSEAANTSLSHSASDYNLHMEKLVLAYPLFKGELKAGQEASSSKITNRYNNTGAATFNNIDRNAESRLAVFSAYTKTFNKTTVKGGLRYEYLETENESELRNNETWSKTYNTLFPSLSVSFPVQKTKVSLSYSTRIQRPGFEMLNSSVEYANRFIYRQGNPAIRPQYTHDVTGSLIFKDLFGSLSYQYAKNFITSVIDRYENRSDVLLRSFVNVPHKEQLNLSLTYSPKTELWEPSFNLYVSQQFLSIDYSNGKKHFNNPTATFSTSNELSLPKNFALSMDMSVRTGGNVNLQQRKADWNVDLNVRKMMMNNALAIIFGGMDIFKTQRDYYTLYGTNFTSAYRRAVNTRLIQLAVIYRFNSTYDKYRGSKTADYSERFKKEAKN